MRSSGVFPYQISDASKFQFIEPGLSKIEYFALHLMAASVTANDHSRPDCMTPDLAKEHAKSAGLLAKALFEHLEGGGK